MPQEDAQAVVLSHHAAVRHNPLTGLGCILTSITKKPGRLANNCQQVHSWTLVGPNPMS